MPNESEKKAAIHKKHVARLARERQQSRMILYAFIGIISVVVLLLLYGYLDVNYFQAKRPVAKVGDVEILSQDFESRVRLQRQQLLASYNTNMQYQQIFGIDTSQQIQQIEFYLNTPEFLGRQVLDQMINEELIRQEAAKRGITVTEAELDEALQSQFGFFPNGTYTPTVTPTEIVMPEIPAEAFEIVTITPTALPTSELLPTPTVTFTPELVITGTPPSTATLVPTATFTPTLAPTATATTGPTATVTPTATPYTLEGYQTEYNATLDSFTKFGINEVAYRKLVELQILQQKLTDEVAVDVTSTEEQVWARHILVSDGSLAVALIERLKAGEDFATLASEFSDDTGSAVNGGDLGWFGKGAMVAEFETAAFALENPGDFTLQPVQSQFGYHIIQLIAKQDRPLTSSQFEQARSTFFADWLATVREDYTIETYDEFWIQRVPTEPNFITMATEAADAANTQNAEDAAAVEATATP